MHAYKGTFFHEAQVGALVVQVKHSDEVDGPKVRVWRDPMHEGPLTRAYAHLDQRAWDHIATGESVPWHLNIRHYVLHALMKGGRQLS